MMTCLLYSALLVVAAVAISSDDMVLGNSVDVCLYPSNRTVQDYATIKHCGVIKRSIVTCFASPSPYFASVIFSHIPELVPGTATVAITPSDCAATVSRMERHGIKTVVFVDVQAHWTAHAFLLKRKGEVFESHACNSSSAHQITAFRARPSDRDCHWLHYLQFAQFLYDTYSASARDMFFATVLREKTRKEALAVLAAKPRFAAFGFGKFRLERYHGDFVVRHAFTELLRRRNIGQIEALGNYSSRWFAQRNCPGSFAQMYECLKPYRFAIVMENSNFPGYVSEKLLNAFLAQSVPVYFGAEDVTTYFNEEAMVVCRIAPEETVVLRAAHRNNYPMLAQKTYAAIVEWTVTVVERSLQSCIDQTARLANDRNAYLRVLMAHPLAQRRSQQTYIDGFDTSCQLVRILEAAQPNFFPVNRTRSTCLNKSRQID
jgi:hypothetical protein